MAAPNIEPSGRQRPQGKVDSLLTIAGSAILWLSLLLSCRQGPEIAEYPPFIQVPQETNMNKVPVILVGRVLSSSDIGKPRPSKWDPRFLTQLSEVTVAVENVLQGSVNRQEIPIYYFVIASSHDGNRLLGDWRPGERDLFYLQKDSGVFRTICDNYRSCVTRVLTGAHPNWKRDPTLYITDDILRFMLSRGENCDDAAMLEAVNLAQRYGTGDPQERDVIRAVEQVAIHETPPVQHGACQVLAYWGDGYFKERAGDPLQASLRSACGSTLKEQ